MTEQEKENFTPIEHRADRDLVQSYIFTFSRYGEMSVFEKRILYNMIYDKQIQDYVRECIENKKNGKEKNPFPYLVGYKMPLNKITQNEGNYADVKKAFINLSKRGFEYEDNKVWKYVQFILLPVIRKYEGYAYFQVSKDVYDVITDIRHGYRQFDLEIALSLRSVYSMRFYEMFSRQDDLRKPQKRKIEELKKLLRLENKYTENSMFVKRILEPAKEELDEKANYSFNYELQKSFGSRKKDIVSFTVYHIPENERKNEELLENREKAELSKYIHISKSLYERLEEFGFTKEGIHSNLYRFYIGEDYFIKQAKGDKHKGLEMFLKQLDVYKQRALKNPNARDNWQGYVVKTLEKAVGIANDKERAEKIAAYKATQTFKEEPEKTFNKTEEQEQNKTFEELKKQLSLKFGV